MPRNVVIVQSKAGRPSRMALVVAALLMGSPLPLALGQSPPGSKPVTAELGASTYKNSCAACHQENGRGVPAAFPPLAAHVPNLVAKPGGRDYLIRVMLSGLQGPIDVGGQAYSGVMPDWKALGDSEIAAVLNHITTAWDNKARLAADFKPYESNEIASARTDSMNAAAVHALRQNLFPQAQQAASDQPWVAVTFTGEQVTQGKATYDHSCRDCHGAALDDGEFGGAPLRGSYFRKRWGDGNVASLYAYMKSKMPPDRPGALSDKVYVDVLAYILQANGYKSGDKELPTDPKAQQAMSLKRD